MPRTVVAAAPRMTFMVSQGVGGEQLVNETCWGRIRSYMRFKLLHYYATYLDSDYVDAVHDWCAPCGGATHFVEPPSFACDSERGVVLLPDR